MKNQTDKTVSEQSPNKARKSKSREITSRFLSPTSTTSSIETGISSPIQTLSPIRRKTTGLFIDTARKHRSVEEIGLTKGLWPSSSSSSSSSSTSTSQSSSKKFDTLADHLGNDRLKDLMERKNEEKSSNNGSHNQFLSRQRSCSSEFSRFEKEKESSKENYRPIIGGSMRYTGKFRFSGKTVSSSNKSSSSSSSNLVPGRLSVDENALNLNRRSSRRSSEYFINIVSSGSESSDILSGSTDFSSPAIGKNNSSFSSSNLTSNSFLTSTASSRTSGMDVSSRYMNDQCSRLRRGTSDSHIQTPITLENSLNSNNLTQKNPVKRANSMTGYGSATSQWALSPGRSLGSLPVSVETNKGKPIGNFSNLRPPNSPSKSKGVGNFLSLGLEMFKSKKSSSSSSSPLGHEIGENAHQLRLLHNRSIQWRFVNARADAVNSNKITQAEINLVNAWASLSNLQSSVVQKRIHFEKEKLELKLNSILQSQVKPLEAWGDMERQHLSAVSMTKDCLHSVVCRVPLIEGAKLDPQLASIALRHSTDLTASIKKMLLDFSPAAQKTGSLLSELAEVVAREKLLLEECFELVGLVSAREIQERSLKCNIVQLKLHQQQLLQQQQQQQGMIVG